MENPAAWHPDPSGKHDHRWWDGQRWTEHVADGGVASVDPLPAAPGTGDEAGVELPSSGDAGATRPSGDAGEEEPGPSGDAEPGGPADGAGTAGTGTTEQQPVWSQQPQHDQPTHGQRPPPGQQAWGGAPAAGTPWGQQPAWGPGPGPGQPQQAGGLAIAALVTGILSLPLLIAAGLGGVVGIVAVVLGVVALRRANRGEAGGRGLAIGGIVTGAISIVLGIILAIFFFSVGMGVFQEMDACMRETGGDQAECERRLERELTDRFLGD